MMKPFRIFISSPADVAKERKRMRVLIAQLRRHYLPHLDLKVVAWEDMPLEANCSFQEGIEAVLEKLTIDVAIFILWGRFGSPLGPNIRKRNGGEYDSGTEREFDLMTEARLNSTTGTPRILVYSRSDEVAFHERLRDQSTEEKSASINQKLRVERFLREEFEDAARNSIRARHSYQDLADFTANVRKHLQTVLDEQVSLNRSTPLWPIEEHGAPFRGLEPFEYHHADIFFGREDEILEIQQALSQRARDGCGFLLITGASGTGKSSLARAGVLPAIVTGELDESVKAWRHAVFTPSELGDNLTRGLALLLIRLLPEMEGPGFDQAVFCDDLNSNPELLVRLLVVPTLVKITNGGKTRLIILIDQFEEIFTDQRITEADLRNWAAAVTALIRSGAVWVLATIRSDYYDQFQKCHLMLSLKPKEYQYDLHPPDPISLRRLIDKPAWISGLSFQAISPGHTLSDKIYNDSIGKTELLPLVEHLLLQLFENRSREGELTLDAYIQLGGVGGALAQHAEKLFMGLSDHVKREFSFVFRRLVSPLSVTEAGGGGRSVVRRKVALSSFTNRPAAVELIKAFTTGRLMVASSDSEGQAEISVAHEAIFRVWERAAEWVAVNSEFLRIRDRVTGRREENLLLTEKDPLTAQARREFFSSKEDFSDSDRFFLEKSFAQIAADTTARHRSRRRVLWGMVALTAVSVCGAAISGIKWSEAAEQRTTAELSTAASEQLISDMLFKLKNQLEPLGKLELLESLAATTKQYLDKFPPDERNLKGQRQKAALMASIGEIQLARENTKDAEISFTTALNIRNQIAPLASDMGEAMRDLWSSYNALGGLKLQKGEYSEAKELMLKSLSLADILRNEKTFNATKAAILESVSLGKLGLLDQHQQRFDDAEARFEASLKVVEALVGVSQEEKEEIQSKLSTCHNQLGGLYAAKGNLNLASQHYVKARRIREELKDTTRDDAAMRRNVSSQYHKAGDLQWAEGKAQDAEISFRDALDIRRSLAKADPASSQAKRDLAAILHKYGDFLTSQGRIHESFEYLREAMDIRRRASDADPSSTAALRLVGYTLDSIGVLQAADHQLDDAMVSHQRSLAIAEKLAEDPENRDAQRNLAVSYCRMGQILVKKREFVKAKEFLEKSLPIGRELATAPQTSADSQSYYCDALEAAAVAAMELGDLFEADKKTVDALTIRRLVADRDFKATIAQSKLCRCMELRSTVLRKSGDRSGARDLLKNARSKMIELSDKCPEDGFVWLEFENICKASFEISSAEGWWVEAGETARQREERFQSAKLAIKIAKGQPGNSVEANIWQQLCIVNFALDNGAEAFSCAQRAIRLEKDLISQARMTLAHFFMGNTDVGTQFFNECLSGTGQSFGEAIKEQIRKDLILLEKGKVSFPHQDLVNKIIK